MITLTIHGQRFRFSDTVIRPSGSQLRRLRELLGDQGGHDYLADLPDGSQATVDYLGPGQTPIPTVRVRIPNP